MGAGSDQFVRPVVETLASSAAAAVSAAEVGAFADYSGVTADVVAVLDVVASVSAAACVPLLGAAVVSDVHWESVAGGPGMVFDVGTAQFPEIARFAVVHDDVVGGH